MDTISFFQAEDGIRDADVTGVQTCALPISDRPGLDGPLVKLARGVRLLRQVRVDLVDPLGHVHFGRQLGVAGQIGRASCRERVRMTAVAVSLNRKPRRLPTHSARSYDRTSV